MRRLAAALGAASVATLVLATGTALAGSGGSTGIAPLQPTVGTATAFDKSPPLRDMEMIAPGGTAQPFSAPAKTDRSLVGPVANTKHQADGALQSGLSPNAMPSPLFTFEGPKTRTTSTSSESASTRRIRTAMSGSTTTSPRSTWRSPSTRRPEPCCTGRRTSARSGKASRFRVAQPTVATRSSSTTRSRTAGSSLSSHQSTGTLFWNCVAVSTTGDPLGSYYRYAFSTGDFLPGLPEVRGSWADGLYITTREFGPTDTDYRIGVYAINRHQLGRGRSEPDRRLVLPRRRRRSALPPG